MEKLSKRAIEVCSEYDNVKRKIDELTSKIHNRFTACEERQRKKLKEEWDGKEPEWKFNRDTLSEVEPCLNMGYQGQEWNCEDCKKAYQLIQDRKKARQEFGIAKRRVRAVARSKRKLND